MSSFFFLSCVRSAQRDCNAPLCVWSWGTGSRWGVISFYTHSRLRLSRVHSKFRSHTVEGWKNWTEYIVWHLCARFELFMLLPDCLFAAICWQQRPSLVRRLHVYIFFFFFFRNISTAENITVKHTDGWFCLTVYFVFLEICIFNEQMFQFVLFHHVLMRNILSWQVTDLTGLSHML